MFREGNPQLRRADRDAAEVVSLSAGEGYQRGERYTWLVSSPFILSPAGLPRKKEGKTHLMNMVMQVGPIIALRVPRECRCPHNDLCIDASQNNCKASTVTRKLSAHTLSAEAIQNT